MRFTLHLAITTMLYHRLTNLSAKCNVGVTINQTIEIWFLRIDISPSISSYLVLSIEILKQEEAFIIYYAV